MARALAQTKQDIQALSDADKKALLCTLWEELDGPADPDLDAAWLEEAKRRDQEIEDGVVEMIPADEVFRKLEALLEE
jgi:hypothetical protein